MSVALQSTRKFAAYSLPGTQEVNSGEKTKKAAAPATTAASKVTKAVPSVQNTSSAAANSSPSVNIEELLLTTLAHAGEIADTWEFAASNGLDHQEVVGAVKSLLTDFYVVDSPLSSTVWTLTEEGKEVLEKGSPEIQVLKAIPEGGISIAALNSQLGEVAKIGMGVCMKNKWIAKKGDNVEALITNVEDETVKVLQHVAQGTADKANTNDLNNLKKRKMVNQATRKSYRISKGPDFREKRIRKVADLTKAMLGKKEEVSWYIYSKLHFLWFMYVDGGWKSLERFGLQVGQSECYGFSCYRR